MVFPRRLLNCRSLARPRPDPRLAKQQRSWLSNETKAPVNAPQDIAVLGGGLTGLTTAYYLTRFHPTASITLYEADNRLGGWLDTQIVNAASVGKEDAGLEGAPALRMERGARTVAPQTRSFKWEDFVLYELLHELNCAKEVYHIPQNNPILSNRYIYYPDHLVALPSGIIRGFFKRLKFIYKLLTEPVFQGTLPALYRWQTSGAAKYRDSPQGDQPPNKLAIAGIQDISVGEYLLARTGSTSLVNNLASAVLHGIWGGDVWKLSALEGTFQNDYLRYKLPLRQGDGAKALVKHSDYFSGSDILMRTPEVADFVSLFAKDAYLGFGKGFSTLANELVDELRRNPKVTIKQATPVTHLRYNREAKQTSVTTASKETQGHDKVISSLYSGTLAKLTGDALPALKGSAAVTIQIVNLWYEKVQLEKNYPGFGYLIPQSVPLENNPHAALGVIFDSDRDAAAGIDDRPDRGTNLTVMLGGHYWDHIDPTLWPSEKEVIAMAKDTVQRQLGISAEEPCRASTKLCRDCIPQHLVGHRDRMAQAHRELCDSFEGTLAVVGGSYTMPGVLPSLQAARDVALAASGQGYMVDPELRGNTFAYDMKHVGETGLGRFVGDNETLQLVPLQELPFRGKSRVRRFNHSSFQQ